MTRKRDEAIRLGEDIRIVLVQIKGGQVRLGIECPSTMRVLREELYETVRKENLNALSSRQRPGFPRGRKPLAAGKP
jgi:carbon storage regulator